MQKIGQFIKNNMQTLFLLLGIALFSIGLFLISVIVGFIGLGVIFILLGVYINNQFGGG